MPDKSIAVTIVKRNNEKRLVTAITNTVTDSEGRPIIDHEGDIILIDNLEDAFIKSFADDMFGGQNKGGEMHWRDGGVDVVQFFTLSHEERIALGFGPGPEIGIVKLRVNDDRLWQKVKDREYPEVSIQGLGERIEMEYDDQKM